MGANKLAIGQGVRIQRTFSQRDFDRFAALSGDDNPIHVDEAFAARTRFGRPVAHGMLLYSAVEGVLGAHMPGPGSLPFYQALKFPTPTYTGEEVTIQVSVTGIDEAGMVELETLIIRPEGELGLEGLARVLPPVREPDRPRHPEPPSSPDSDVTLGKFRLGLGAELRRVFRRADLAEYADLSGPCNPLVTDSGYARRMGLQGQLIPGGLIGGLFSTLLGTRLPGSGTNYLKQDIYYVRPATPDQELLARVEIVRIRAAKQLINLRTTCRDRSGAEICRGMALVLVRDVQA